MKTKAIVLLTLIIALLLTIIVREKGILEMDLHKANNELSSDENWTSIASSEPSKVKEKMVSKKDLSILILYGKDTLYKKINKLAPIVVTLTRFEHGPMWFPLYKSTKYVATAYTSFSEGRYDPSDHGISRQLQGNIDVTGELTILGICSNRSAKKILYASILNNVAEKVIDKFSELPEGLFIGPMKNSLAYKK